jgi:hypothetical protein
MSGFEFIIVLLGACAFAKLVLWAVDVVERK